MQTNLLRYPYARYFVKGPVDFIEYLKDKEDLCIIEEDEGGRIDGELEDGQDFVYIYMENYITDLSKDTQGNPVIEMLEEYGQGYNRWDISTAETVIHLPSAENLYNMNKMDDYPNLELPEELRNNIEKKTAEDIFENKVLIDMVNERLKSDIRNYMFNHVSSWHGHLSFDIERQKPLNKNLEPLMINEVEELVKEDLVWLPSGLDKMYPNLEDMKDYKEEIEREFGDVNFRIIGKLCYDIDGDEQFMMEGFTVDLKSGIKDYVYDNILEYELVEYEDRLRVWWD